MKKMIFLAFVAALFLTACDGFNNDIDDLSRDITIIVRTIGDLEFGGSYGTDEAEIDVSSSNGEASDTDVGTVRITSTLKDNYVRSDSVDLEAENGSSYVFGYWLFPSRTDDDTDDESTEGNIRYDGMADAATSTGVSISLRTDGDPAELIGVFALDGNATLGDVGDGGDETDSILDTFEVTASAEGSDEVDLTMSIETTVDINIRESYYRVFDEDGEALTDDWELFYQEDDDDEYIISHDGFVDDDQDPDLEVTYTLEEVSDRSSMDDWKVIIIYTDDDSGDIYVLRESDDYY